MPTPENITRHRDFHRRDHPRLRHSVRRDGVSQPKETPKVRTLKELTYVEKKNTILLGVNVGSAILDGGAKLDIVASGKIVRFTVTGCEGHVDLDLTNYASNAAEWLLANSKNSKEPEAA